MIRDRANDGKAVVYPHLSLPAILEVAGGRPPTSAGSPPAG